ncbi:MAG: SufD family Fe-S cluster assembly protein [bacterium]
MNKLPLPILKSASVCGFNIHEMTDKNTPHLFLHYNKILSTKEIPGVELIGKELANGFKGTVRIKKNAKIKKPIYFCFGVTAEKGNQLILPDFVIEDGAEATILAHCSFPNARDVTHQMTANIKIGRGAKYTYEERHYHGLHSGAKVFPNFKVLINPGGIFNSTFILSEGTVGKVKITVEVEALAKSSTMLAAKVLGKNKKDEVEIFDKIYLKGASAKSLIKMRAAAVGGGQVLMQGETYASAPGAFGHVDCREIVRGKGSRAKAIPIVEVTNDQARVTHEASVGKINQKELDTLMARGLDEEEATEFLIKGLLK